MLIRLDYLALEVLVRPSVLVVQRHSSPIREDAHRFAKGHIFTILNEREQVAALAAPETLEQASLGADRERGGFFAVEWAKADPTSAGSFERDVLGYEYQQVNPCEDFLFRLFKILQRGGVSGFVRRYPGLLNAKRKRTPARIIDN